ncbi:hypothetical protein ACFWHV_21730 [Streptomyces collinus]|uniref:hypothetical protein n=1 Tax=Streptomyces collinus TaxID=42684 RepID=UPI003657A3F8
MQNLETNPCLAPEAEQLMQSTTTATPPLLVNVPLRNSPFLGRQMLLRPVEEQFGAQEAATVLPHALHGFGGVGKSQLALEHVYTHRHDYKVIWWIPAERESLILAVLAELLKLAQREIDAQLDVREVAAGLLPGQDVRRRSRAGPAGRRVRRTPARAPPCPGRPHGCRREREGTVGPGPGLASRPSRNSHCRRVSPDGRKARLSRVRHEHLHRGDRNHIRGP